MQKKDYLFIFFVLILQFSISLTFSNNNPYETAFRIDKDKTVRKIKYNLLVFLNNLEKFLQQITKSKFFEKSKKSSVIFAQTT